jgi:hypothetical protein
LFTLQADPQVVRYFEELAGDFYLYVGADMLVRALSERYLQSKDQMMRNTLAMARDAGATLVLTEPVLEEVINHLRVSQREYAEHFAVVDNYMTIDIARHSDKILIRAYFYAKLNPLLESRPTSWQQYVGQFCPESELARSAAYGYIKSYLQTQFGLQFETREELEKLTAAEEVASLTEALSKDKQIPALAKNDALLALAVYGRRADLKEYAETSEFGYRTWWLTGESMILKYTNDIVRAHHGERYMMRPQFLLNFIALAPSVAEVRRSYAKCLPLGPRRPAGSENGPSQLSEADPRG